MSNAFVNRMKEGLPLNQGHHPEGCTRDDIACAEMMEIIRWENEGGRIGLTARVGLGAQARPDDTCELDAGLERYGETIAYIREQFAREEITNDDFYPGARYRMD